MDNMPTTCPTCQHLLELGDWPFCPHGKPGPFWTGDSAIHTSEQVVVIRNPKTGETRIPGRADRPIHPKYKAAGFTERCAISSHSELRSYERTNGVLHEKSHYNNSGTAERDTGSK